MNIINRGDIYYIFSNANEVGSEQIAGRPAVIVSNNAINEYSQVVEVVFLTTQPKKDLPTHVPINCSKHDSTALCEQITTISKDRIGDRMGRCTPEELHAITVAMQDSLSIQFFVEARPSYEELDRVVAERDIYKRLYDELIQKVIDSKT